MKKMNQYFPKLHEHYIGNVKVELDLSNFVTKADLKEATAVDTSNLASKSDLAGLKAEVDKIDIDKLRTIHIDPSNLNNVVDNDVVKKSCVW